MAQIKRQQQLQHNEKLFCLKRGIQAIVDGNTVQQQKKEESEGADNWQYQNSKRKPIKMHFIVLHVHTLA